MNGQNIKYPFLLSIALIILLIGCSSCEKSQKDNDDDTGTEGYYTNPIFVPQPGRREIADPSIFKYKNKYYLLSTQMYSNDGPGMLIWESKDLVNWSQPKNVLISGTVDPMMAPELVYHEGSYYLYWSIYPGEKHYMAKYTPGAESGDFDPFGDNAEYTLKSLDFLKVGNPPENVNIDGEIFFDKNDVYMFYCGMGGIQYKKLESLDNAGTLPKAQLTDCVVTGIKTDPGDPGSPGWTEAPGLFFDDGYYYLTYSGNHFQSNHYQIHSARGTNIETIKPYKQNPLIYKYDGVYNGMGNNNFIAGPNLKTKYMSFHTKIGEGIHTWDQGPINRQMMLEKYTVSVAHGIETNAPDFGEQPIPSSVEWENDMTMEGGNMETSKPLEIINGVSRVTDGEVVSKDPASTDFVIEGNIRGFSAEADICRYGLSSVDGKIKFAIELADNGKGTRLMFFEERTGWKDLEITSVVFNVWHTLKIDKKEGKIKFYYDDRYVGETTTTLNKQGRFGYFVEGGKAEMSWLGKGDY